MIYFRPHFFQDIYTAVGNLYLRPIMNRTDGAEVEELTDTDTHTITAVHTCLQYIMALGGWTGLPQSNVAPQHGVDPQSLTQHYLGSDFEHSDTDPDTDVHIVSII